MIEINNLTVQSVKEDLLKKVAEKILKGESASWRKEKKDLSIALVGQERIRELNKKYRGENRVTDVLSFSYDNLGEIVICLSEVKKNAKRLKSTFQKELIRVLIHGILHLLGEDHEKSRKEAELMEKKEEYYLSKVSS